MNGNVPDELAPWRAVRPLGDLIAPRAAEIDASGSYPEDLHRAFADLGLLALSLPVHLGGVPNGVTALTGAVVEAARHSSAAGLMLLLSRLPVAPILIGGTPEQAEEWVRPHGQGQTRGAFAMSEPQAGSDVLGIAAVAERDGDTWRIDGRKAWISGGAEADWFVVVARESGTPARSGSGIRAFIVDAAAAGLSIVARHERPGGRGVSLVDIDLSGVEVSESRRLPDISGAGPLLGALASLRPIVSARGVGLASAAMELAVERVRTRMVGGRPLADQQGIQWQLADVAVALESASLLTARAASLVDAGRTGPEVAGRLAAAKLASSHVAVDAARLVAQLHGAEGCLAGHPAERLVRDARQLTVVEGTSEIQRNIIGRSVVDGHLRWDGQEAAR